MKKLIIYEDQFSIYRIVLLILLLCSFQSDLTAQNMVYNTTDRPEIDTLMKRGLDILNIKGQLIFILDERSMFTRGDMTQTRTSAYIQKRRGHYIIAINFELAKHKLPLVIAHELIHLKQHTSKQLVDVNDSLTVFKSKVYNRNQLPYSLYPWEQQAFKLQTFLSEQL